MGYHWGEYCRTVIRFPADEHNLVYQSMATPSTSTPSASLGPWAGRLLPELLRIILLRMDMLSLFRLRHTNLAWRRMVDLLQPFQLKTIPGDYALDPTGPSTRGHNSSSIIVSTRQVKQLFDHIPHKPPHPCRSALDKGKAACTLSYYDKRLAQVDFGLCCAGCRLNFDQDKFDMVNTREAILTRKYSYSRNALLEHFQWCRQAQYLWKESLKGNKLNMPAPPRARLHPHQQRLQE